MIRLVLCFILIFASVQAEMPAGHDDPEFQEAVTQWLDGDNSALHIFHRLAGEGNVAALIMRWRASKWITPNGPGNIDYIWLDFAENSPLALAFGISWYDLPEVRPDAKITQFMDLGELQTAATYLSRVIQERREENTPLPVTQSVLHRILTSELDLPWRLFLFLLFEKDLSYGKFLAIYSQLCTAAEDTSTRFHPLEALCTAGRTGDAELEQALRAALFSSPHKEVPPNGAAVVSDWLASRPDLPYWRTCKAICSTEVQACTDSVFEMTWRLSGFFDIQSPVETIIPQKTYLASRRAARELWNMLLRQHQLYKEHPSLEKPENWARSPSCLLDAVASEAEPWRISQ